MVCSAYITLKSTRATSYDPRRRNWYGKKAKQANYHAICSAQKAKIGDKTSYANEHRYEEDTKRILDPISKFVKSQKTLTCPLALYGI